MSIGNAVPTTFASIAGAHRVSIIIWKALLEGAIYKHCIPIWVELIGYQGEE